MLIRFLLPLFTLIPLNTIAIRSDCVSCYTALFIQPILPHNSIYSRPLNSEISDNGPNEGYWLNGTRIPDSIQPINDYVLVEQPNSLGSTSGGIILSGRKQRMSGKVIAVGPGLVSNTGKTIPLQLKIGDIVMHSQANPDQVLKYNGKECVLIKASDVFCKIEANQYGYMDEGASSESVQPLGSRVLIKVLSQPGVTESGLVLSKSDNGLARGEVLKIGPGDYTNDGILIPITDLSVGQQILYPQEAAQSSLFSLNRDTFALIPIKHVQAKI